MGKSSDREHATHTRLAESECASVDLCDCGTLQVHLGSPSLRLPPEMVHSLMRTLQAALAKRKALLTADAQPFVASTWQRADTQRGKA